MAIFEASKESTSFILTEEYTIDIDLLVDKIYTRLHKAQELAHGIENFVIVVTQEEYKCLEYKAVHNMYDNIVPSNMPLRIVKANSFLTRMKRTPVTGLSCFGCSVIGSDFIGELSPMIL